MTEGIPPQVATNPTATPPAQSEAPQAPPATSSAPVPPAVPLGSAGLAAIESPLAGVNPRSLDALMAEDPAKLSEAEFDQVIAAMRALRKGWAESEAKKDAAGRGDGIKPLKAPAKPRGPKAKGTVTIDLAELFGDDK